MMTRRQLAVLLTFHLSAGDDDSQHLHPWRPLHNLQAEAFPLCLYSAGERLLDSC